MKAEVECRSPKVMGLIKTLIAKLVAHEPTLEDAKSGHLTWREGHNKQIEVELDTRH